MQNLKPLKILTVIALFMAAFITIMLSSCSNRCDIDEQQYATFTNTFSTDITIEFRHRGTLAVPFTIYTEIIPANETKSIFLGTKVHDTRYSGADFKINCRQDSYDSNVTDFQMSNNSLSEYNFCYSPVVDNGIDIQAIGNICDNGFAGITKGY